MTSYAIVNKLLHYLVFASLKLVSTFSPSCSDQHDYASSWYSWSL